MYILGINAYHGDSSACLLKDGKLVAALEEERIRRIKHWAGFPSEAIKFCLDYAGIGIEEIDYVAISRNPLAHFWKKVLRVILKVPRLSFLLERTKNIKKVMLGVKPALASAFGIPESKIKARIINVEHHRAHLASAFFVSPFHEAAIVSVDGFGDFSSTMTGTGSGNKIKILDTVAFPHSLGIFYTALTQFLGFWNYGDEYKVMGLAAFGKPVYADKLRKVVNLDGKTGLFSLETSYFLHDKEGVEMTWLNDKPVIGRLFSKKLKELLGEPRREGEELDSRHKDIAASVQEVYEEAFFRILNNLNKKTGLENLVLAGGCAQNSLANGKIYEKTAFRNIYVPPAGHDAGTALGAAFYVWNQILGKERGFVMNSAFWGPEYSDGILKSKLSVFDNGGFKVEHLHENDLIKKTAKLIAEGKVVGWFQGRTEWGPRALGARSILANPCLPEMKEILNLKIKKRESFRPFAPSILEEAVQDYFKESRPVSFMEKVYVIKPEKRKIIPAVVHEDGTGRLQSVNPENNPLYYRLIKEVGSITGVPIVLNTSFNENEPIVNKPEEAIDCFLRTKMDALAMGNYLIQKK
ncbi:MAG: carbamoyltransferase [Candidatus Wolfebacteria bacterium]|nr:carbamoyltransferase [Candidatus Wolfebacteria bacterium]